MRLHRRSRISRLPKRAARSAISAFTDGGRAMNQQCFEPWELGFVVVLFIVLTFAAIKAPRDRDRGLWQAIANSQARELEFWREIERRREAAASKTTAIDAVASAIFKELAIEDFELARRAARAAIQAFIKGGVQ